MKKALLITAFALAALGCSSTTPTADAPAEPAANTANTTAANAAPESARSENPVFTGGERPTDDVVSSTRKQLDVRQWSARVESSTSPEMNMTIEFSAPKNYHFKRTDGEVMAVGGSSYVRKNGVWEKLEFDISDQLAEQTKLITEQVADEIQNVEKIGEEKLGGKNTIVYLYRDTVEETGEETTNKVWIDKATGLPLRIDFEGMVEGKAQKISTFYDYDKAVVIEAPKIN